MDWSDGTHLEECLFVCRCVVSSEDKPMTSSHLRDEDGRRSSCSFDEKVPLARPGFVRLGGLEAKDYIPNRGLVFATV